MSAITRRLMLGGLAAAPAVGLAGREMTGPAAPEGLPAIESLPAAYMADGAENRLRHHLMMAAVAMQELAPGANERWWVNMHGKAPFGVSFEVAKYETYRDFSHPKVPNGMLLERRDIIISRGWGRS